MVAIRASGEDGEPSSEEVRTQEVVREPQQTPKPEPRMVTEEEVRKRMTRDSELTEY